METNTEIKAEILSKSVQQVMGKILDLVRISEVSDRAQQQMERTIKVEFHKLIDYLNLNILEISKDDKVKK